MANIEKRINKDGNSSYRARVRLKGHPVQTATFQRLTDAKIWVQQTEAAIREGRYFKTAKAKKHTMGDLLDKYTREILDLRPDDTANQRHYLKYWKDKLGDYILADVTPGMITDYRNQLIGTKNRYGREIGPTTANRYTTALGHVFTVALNQWEWIDQNPVRKISKLKEPRGRVRFLSDKEREKLLATCKESGNPYLYMVVILALSTGARKNELLRIRWPDVDLMRGMITLHETKNGERRSLPVRGFALKLLQQHAENRPTHSEYVFPSTIKDQPIDIRTAWENAMETAKLEDFRFHDLRHSAASYLAMNGASIAEIAEVLGHKTLQMVKRYSHLSESHTASVVEKMNDKIFAEHA